MTLLPSLDALYAVTSFATLFAGVVGLAAGVRDEVVAPVVLVGAVIVGMISLYWWFGGEGAYGSA